MAAPMPSTRNRKPENQNALYCPECNRRLSLEHHAELVCDGQVWCLACRQYHPELTTSREFPELMDWAAAICTAFDQNQVWMLENPEARYNWRLYWEDDRCLLAEAYHDQRTILLYPPGMRLTSLCHELAHIFTGQDHTPAWAETFAILVAWVKNRLLG